MAPKSKKIKKINHNQWSSPMKHKEYYEHRVFLTTGEKILERNSFQILNFFHISAIIKQSISFYVSSFPEKVNGPKETENVRWTDKHV